MKDSRNCRGVCVGVVRSETFSPHTPVVRCVVCGQALAEPEIDWDDMAADPAFYYVPSEAGSKPTIATSFLKS